VHTHDTGQKKGTDEDSFPFLSIYYYTLVFETRFVCMERELRKRTILDFTRSLSRLLKIEKQQRQKRRVS